MPQSQAPNPQALPDTLPANYDFSQGQPQAAPQGQTQAPNPQALPDTLPADYDFNKQPDRVDPRQTGEITNDVGQKVIVPKDGESFSDTVKRAVAYHKSLTPEQQQAALDAEAKTAPKKAIQTLGAAATIGAVGPAVMALPGEIAEAVPSVLTHTIEGVKAIGTWAAKNPVQAYLLFQVMKEIVPGAKKAMGIVKGIPEAE